MIGIFAKIKSSFLWIAVLKAVEEKRFSQALEKLRKAFGLLNNEMPSTEVVTEYNLICALIAYNTADYSLSYRAINVALIQLCDASNVHYMDFNDNDRRYLTLYAYSILDNLPEDDELDGQFGERIQRKQVNFALVDQRLRSLFPVK